MTEGLYEDGGLAAERSIVILVRYVLKKYAAGLNESLRKSMEYWYAQKRIHCGAQKRGGERVRARQREEVGEVRVLRDADEASLFWCAPHGPEQVVAEEHGELIRAKAGAGGTERQRGERPTRHQAGVGK